MRRDLQTRPFQLTGLSGATVRSSWMHRRSRHCASATSPKAEPSSAGLVAKRAVWAGRETSCKKAWAAAIVVIPARASSFGSLS
jgi:hypothetical protein